MTNTNHLGPRPANPAEISFDRSCFRQVGTRTEYRVTRSAIHSGPAVFLARGNAEEYIRGTHRQITEHEVPILERVSWTKP